MTRKVLIVGDPSPDLTRSIEALGQEPYDIEVVSTPASAHEAMQSVRYSVVVANESIGGARGSEFLADVQKRSPSSVRLIISEGREANTVIDAVNRAEIYRVIAPPFSTPQLAKILRDALTVARVAEAQEAVWNAARQQQSALQELVSKHVSHAEADGAVTAARFAGLGGESTTSSDAIGELPEEHAKRLSTRENEIVQALGSGRRVKDIAQDLVISTHTVRNHLKAIYRKLNVRSQFELISLMARNSRES